MLISCPNCKTTFAVPAKYIGGTGRKLKCSKCAHIWLQEPINFDKESLNNLLRVDPVSGGLPANFKKQKLKLAYVISFVLLILISLTLAISKNPVKYPVLAEKIGLHNFEGLRFHNFKVEGDIVDKKLDFTLKGTVVNMTDKKVKMPVIHVKAYSQGGRVMAEKKIHPVQEYIEAFSQVDVSPEISGISGNADRLQLSFENWLEAIFQ